MHPVSMYGMPARSNLQEMSRTMSIGEYNATTGATVASSLVSGLSNPQLITVFGGNLFVAVAGSGTIGEYNATTGATINASLVSGLSSPVGVVVSGGNLWETNAGT